MKKGNTVTGKLVSTYSTFPLVALIRLDLPRFTKFKDNFP